MATTPRDHIEQIRRSKFSIGGEANPLTEDLHQAVKNLSAELYAKDVHFLMELIQNAEDNEYLEDVDPSLEFVITAKDITHTGAPATLLIFNNEKGFSAKNIESVCSVGRSTKKGNRKRGYIGEKGIGFKSVFLITSQPHIFSNGYQIKFNEAPCPHCNLGYIVPEWIENLTPSDIKQIYGSASTLPTTTIVLPLKADKLKPVKQQLSSIHPEVLLFLSKIKRLSVKEDTEDPRLSTLSAISILRETNFLTRKMIDAESYTLYLSAGKDSDKSEAECSYYMWKQKFPVKHENRVDKRLDAEELVITLAFPNGERLNRDGRGLPGVYAFLPTEMLTNFPFIIQSDFILSSSREYILFDDKWNRGILDCVPTAFVNALTALVKGTADAPLSNVPHMFKFLPINESNYKELNAVRESIRAKLVEENIIPSESYTGQKFFHKPCDVARIMPTFWDILRQARGQGLSLQNLSSHGCYILSSSFDKAEYDNILEFLEVKSVTNEWYAKCIQGSDIAASVSDEVYMKLLIFLADGWSSRFQNTSMKSIPVIKYSGLDGNVSFCSIQKSAEDADFLVCVAIDYDHASWLIDWNKIFTCGRCYFVPALTQKALLSSTKREKILQWLREQVKVFVLSVSRYADVICNSLSDCRQPIIAYGHFLYHSFLKKYMSESDVRIISGRMPLLDSYGSVIKNRKGVLVPASGSKWAGLIGSNPWREEGYVELGEDYLRAGHFAGHYTPKEELIKFLKSHVAASDVPRTFPPNAALPAASSLFTKQNAFLLLDWICNLKLSGNHIPEKFLTCIKKGSWLRVKMSGSYGYRPPSESFHLTKAWGEILQNGSVLVDIPLIDKSFYGDEIEEYKEVLKTVGVMFDHEKAYEFIGNHFMSMASSSLTRANVISILTFIKFLRERMLSPDKLINSIERGRWVRTLQGERSPGESVLSSDDWKVPSQISNIPFIDTSYYGEEIFRFKPELQLLGVVIGFNDRYSLVIDNLNPSRLTSLTPEALLLLLKCLSHNVSPNKICNSLRSIKCIKTDCGYKSPGECFMFDPAWGCLLKVFNSFPLIEQRFYGSNILQYTNELRRIGVVVDFDDAVKQFANTFKKQVSLSSLTKENVISFLACYRQLKRTLKFPPEFKQCIQEQKWLRTRLGDYRSPKDCILFDSDWEAIAQISTLPFIADTDGYYGKKIHEYRDELKALGVVVEFKAGAKFVVSCLSLPKNACYLSPSVALSLLECIRLQGPNVSLPAHFMNKVSQIWLKTHIGYKHPEECLLFDSKWSSHLEKTDGSFIDEGFYGSNIASYKEELEKIGFIVDTNEGCSLIVKHFDMHSTLSAIIRIYDCLSEFKWQPEDSESDHIIWIPNGSGNGEWVNPDECVLHDKDELFALQLHVLDKHYSAKVLGFFSKVLGVKSNPSVDDYCKLWKSWESSKEKLALAECCAFWGYVTKQWSAKMEKTLADNMTKIPVASSCSDGVLLLDKCDVFIADDLLLRDLFEKDSPYPLFVWHPQLSKSCFSQTKLTEVYKKIGVRTISESVENKGFCFEDGVKMSEVSAKDVLVKKGMAKLILGFLSDLSLNMDAEKRHEAVKCLLNLTAFVTSGPITLSYSLALSSGKTIDVKGSRNIRWNRELSELYVQKMDRADGYRNLVEHATYVSEVISEGVLWENEQCTGALAELLKLAFIVEFNEETVDFILKSKNLPIFPEDEEFLSSVFP